MTKILKPVCLMVALTLVLSLGVALAPQSGLTPTALASPDSTVIELWSEGPNGTAEWSTDYWYPPGDPEGYSVALTISGTTPGEDGAVVWIPIPSGTTLEDITTLEFYEYVLSGYTEAFQVTLSIYLDANDNGQWDDVWEGGTDDYLYLEGSTTVVDNDWELVDATNFRGTPWSGNGPGPGPYYNTLSYWQQSANYSNYNKTVLAIDLAIGWNAASYDNVTIYVDDLTINEDTYYLEELVADFSAEPTEGPAPLTVEFTDESTGDITDWSWDFDNDGDEDSDDPDPSHTYTIAGIYTVELTVTERLGGTDTRTRDDYITVFVADFSAAPREGRAPLTVQFTEESEPPGVITVWLWHFGDGESSRKQNPSHIYSNTGSYTVRLTVTGPGGTHTETKDDYITVLAPLAPASLFVRNLQISPTEVYPNQAITISAEVVNQGARHGSMRLDLVINGQAEDYTTAGVSPGTAKDISFTTRKSTPGRYEVNIEGETGYFTVLSFKPSPAGAGGLGTGGIIAIVVISVILIGGIIVAFMISRRPA